MIGVVASGPIDHLIVFFDCEVVRYGNRLVMSDQKAELRAISRAPSLHLHVHSWLRHVDGSLAAFSVEMGVFGHPFLVSSPAKLRGLIIAFRNEAVHGPGIPKLLDRTQLIAALSVPFSNVNALYSQVLHQQSPFSSILRLFFQGVIGVLCEVDQCLLDQPADHSWIGPTARNCRGFEVQFADISQ